MNWHLIWQYVISGAIVSWPGTAVMVWLNWRKTREHVDARTAEQNELIAQLTADQTRKLLAGRGARPGSGYHGHEGNSAPDQAVGDGSPAP